MKGNAMSKPSFWAVRAKSLKTEIEKLQTEVEAEGKGLSESSDVTDEQIAAFEQKQAKLETLAGQLKSAIGNVERENATATKSAELAGKFGQLSTTKGVVPTPPPGAVAATPNDHDAEERDHQKYFSQYVAQGRAGLPEGVQSKYFVTSSPNENRANGHNTNWHDAAGGMLVPKSLSAAFLNKTIGRPVIQNKAVTLPMTSGTPGITPLVRPEIMDLVWGSPIPKPTVYDRISIFTSSSGSLTWPVANGSDFASATVDWVEEGTDKHDTDVSFGQLEIKTHELSAYTEASHTLLSRVSVDFEALLEMLFSNAVRYEMDRVILNGNGTTQPLGVLKAPDIQKIPRAQAGNVGWADLVELEGSLNPQMLDRAVYTMNNKVMTGLKLAVDTDGRPLYTPSVERGAFPMFNGYTYITTAQLPVLGTEGDLIFADWSNYFGVLEKQITFRRSDDYQFKKNVASFACFVLFGGRPLKGNAFAVLSDAA